MRILPLVCQGLIWALDNSENATGPSSSNKLGVLEDGPGIGTDRNFGIANQKQGGGMLPMGLQCNDPTPLGDTKERLIFDGGEGKIVNGTEAGINWPFIVRLKIDGLFQCGGAILNEEWIVTASHCLHRMSFVMITLGDLLRTEEEVGEINLLSKEFFTHPNYNPVTMENDIALVRLPKSIRFTNRIKPICLADEPPIIGKECFIAGWGTVSAGGLVASHLLEAKVPIISEPKCSSAESYGSWFKKETMICAGKFDNGGTDSCQGDSGGPLICVEGKTPVLTGVVSWGVGCAQAKKPGVYNRIHLSKRWIERSIQLGKAADPDNLDEAIATTTKSPIFTTHKSQVKPTTPTVTMPAVTLPLLPANLKCTDNTIDSRYGSRLYRSMMQSGMFDRIVMGQDVSVNSWKWITQFGTCGASLIAQRWALTAAHCCNPSVLGKMVTFGSINFDGTGDFTQTVKIVDFHMHIGFERSTFENDICLLQLSQNVKANPNIAPVCLPQDRMTDDFSGNCYIAGWGVLAENTNTIPTILQEAEVPYVKHDRCQTIFQKAGTIFQEKMMCFGGQKSDSCQGDSGGPLVCVENGVPILRGIVSFGKGCGRPGLPGIYTRVSTYIDWIDESIEKMLARTSCGPVRSAFKFVRDDVMVSCSGSSCFLKCKDEGLKPSVSKITCINPVKKRWAPNNRKTPPIKCVDNKTLNSCGPIHQLYKFSSDASVLCNGGKTCTVTCPGNLKPNHAELTCLIPKRRKMKPVIKTFIKCTDPNQIEKGAGSQHAAVEQSLTDPRRPRGACKDIRKHVMFRQWLLLNPKIVVNCQMSCANGKVPCGRPNVSTCKFFCPSGQEAQPSFDATCTKNRGSRFWKMGPGPQAFPRC